MSATLARPEVQLADALWAERGNRLPHRHPGPAARDADAARARRRARLEHARLHQRLPRQPARRGRPGGVEGGPKFTERGIRFLPAVNENWAPPRCLGTQRVESGPRAHGRRRVRPLVRQGPGRGPRRRRAQARQRLRQQPQGRRAGGGGRRPRLRVVLDAAPERLLPGRADAGAVPANLRPGRVRALRLRARASAAAGSASRPCRKWWRARPRWT